MQLGISRSQSFEAQWRNLDFHRSFYRIFDVLPRSEVKPSHCVATPKPFYQGLI